MNYVHPRNEPAVFDKLHHYIFTFHDSTFECVAQSYTSSVYPIASEDERYALMMGMVKARDRKLCSEIGRGIMKPTLSRRLHRLASALNPWPR